MRYEHRPRRFPGRAHTRPSSVLVLSAVLLALGPLHAPPTAAASTHAPTRAVHRSAGRTAHADFNGDGYEDLAVGVPFEDVNGAKDAGAVNVLYGGPNGVQADSPLNQFWSQNSTGVEDQSEFPDHFGWAIATADFNGDGYDDLAIGVPHEGVPLETTGENVPQAGAVNVLYGSAGGLQVDSPADQLWSQESPGIVGLAEHRDWFGYALTAGDFDGDGFADLAVGVRGEDTGGESIPRAGAMDVIYGTSAGLSSARNQHITQDTTGMQDQCEAYDRFGSALASADFNADGFDDVAIGVPYEGIGFATSAGAVQIMFGSAAGLQADQPDDEIWGQDSPGVQDASETGDIFGIGLAAGDFNGDGWPDLAIGVGGEDVGSASDAGAVQVLYGSVAGLQADQPDDQFWSQGSGGLGDSAESGDRFGMELASGDFNGDGFADLAVGVPFEDVGSVQDAGAAQVLYGTSGGLQATSPDDQLWTQGSDGMQDSAEPGDQLGHGLLVGAFQGGPYDALVAGVPFEDLTVADQGAAAVLYGGPDGIQASAPDDQLWSQDSTDVLDFGEIGDEMGFGGWVLTGKLISPLPP